MALFDIYQLNYGLCDNIHVIYR